MMWSRFLIGWSSQSPRGLQTVARLDIGRGLRLHDEQVRNLLHGEGL
jgi:hypothetical protein